MDELRSILYVPAHKRDWVADAPTHGADAVILDLEDSVPVAEKPAAREAIAACRDALAAAETVVTMRVNEPGSDWFYDDVDVVGPWLDAVVVPKAESAAEIRSVETVLEYVEHRQDADERIEILPLIETAAGVYDAHEVLRASDRITAVGGGTSRGGDIQRSLALGWSAEGFETLYLRSKLVLDARAAGVDQLLSGVWATVDDAEGLRAKAARQRRFGYTGMQVVHPVQVEPVNDVFTPDPDDVAHYRDLVEAFERERDGAQGAIEFEGEMVDAAYVKRARRVLERAEAFGVAPE